MKILKQLKLIIIPLLIALLLFGCSKSVEQQIREQLDLGHKYLTELNYEEAIIAFQRVIELDAKNAEAYLGIGKAYVQMNDFHSAIDVLDKGYQNTEDKAIISELETCLYESGNAAFISGDLSGASADLVRLLELNPNRVDVYLKLYEIYSMSGNDDDAAGIIFKLLDNNSPDSINDSDRDRLIEILHLLAKESAINGDKDTTIKLYEYILILQPDDEDAQNELEDRQELSAYEEALKAMALTIINEDDYDFNDAAILSDEFRALVDNLSNVIIYAMDNGKYLAVYPGGYIYYGDMQDGARVGQGYWYYGSAEKITVVNSSWSNDKPNGKASIKKTINQALIEKKPGIDYSIIEQKSGEVKDGVFVGSWNVTCDMASGRTHIWNVDYDAGVMTHESYCSICGVRLSIDSRVYHIKGINETNQE